MAEFQSKFDTLRWRGGCLEMIDQRVLPGEIRYLTYDSAAAVAAGIRDMVVRGAPAIGCAAAYGIALEALRLQRHSAEEFNAGLDSAFSVLAGSRPTAVNLFWALARMRGVWEAHRDMAPGQSAERLVEAAHAILAADVAANRRMGSYGAELVADGASILTHCNAGALATAGHGTALGVIRSAIEAGKKISVFADETRPFLQGARLTAWELMRDQIPTTLIADNMAGHLIARGEIDAVVVGADRIAANGDVANKIGTYTVAVLARENGIPFYVAAPVSTIDLATATGADIPIEERSADEVTTHGGTRLAPAGVGVRNPAFDVTPHRYVSAIICERGVVRAPFLETLRALVS